MEPARDIRYTVGREHAGLAPGARPGGAAAGGGRRLQPAGVPGPAGARPPGRRGARAGRGEPVRLPLAAPRGAPDRRGGAVGAQGDARPGAHLRRGAHPVRLHRALCHLAAERPGHAGADEEHGRAAAAAGAHQGGAGKVSGRSGAAEPGDDEGLQRPGREPALHDVGVPAPAHPHAGAHHAVLRLPERHRVPRGELCLAAGPVAAGPVVHPAHLPGDLDVRCCSG